MRKLLILLPCFILLTIPTKAETLEFTVLNKIDYNFTLDYKLSFINNSFKINNKLIKPFISISDKEQDLSKLNYSHVIKDNRFFYEFGFILNGIALNKIDYIGFDLIGFKRYDDLSYTDGKIRIIFDDLVDKGSLNLMDEKVILYNPSTATIDPTIELLPNATNKGYVSGPSTTERTPSYATIEISSSNYASINVSDTNRYDVAQSSGNSFRCKYNRFIFNLSSIDISTIDWIRYCITGYWYNNVGIGDGGETTQYFNLTSNAWVYDTNTALPFSLLPTGETTNCTNFSGSKILNVVNSSSLFQIGTKIGAEVDVIQTTTHVLFNFINLTVSYTPAVPSTAINIYDCLELNKDFYYCNGINDVFLRLDSQFIYNKNMTCRHIGKETLCDNNRLRFINEYEKTWLDDAIDFLFNF